MQYDYLVFIGRFQPYHSGHHHIATEALKMASKLIFVIGSHDAARSVRNPLTTKERIQLIQNSFDNRDYLRVKFAPQVDYTYNDDRWIAAIQSSVNTISVESSSDNPRIGIVGYDKDHSSYYLKKFPQWDFVDIKPINKINATDVRDYYFGRLDELHGPYKEAFANEYHASNLVHFLRHSGVQEDYKFVKEYKRQWANTPYPVSFQTVDAVVVQSGHVLLVERGARPGKGNWALPGGFVNVNETLKEAVIRELYEETRIAVPKPVLVGSILNTKTYDAPHRSDRGRTITQAYYIKLSDQENLPKIKGSDDAAKAFWVPYSEVVKNRSMFFEDHYSIIEDLVGL